MKDEERIDVCRVPHKSSVIFRGHVVYPSRFSRRAKFKSSCKRKSQQYFTQCDRGEQCRCSGSTSSACPCQSGSPTSVHSDKNPTVQSTDWITCNNGSRSSDSFITNSDPNDNSCVELPAESSRTHGPCDNDELEPADRSSVCTPQRLCSNLGRSYCIRSRNRRRSANDGVGRSGTSYCKSKMIRILVPLLLLFGISISYSMLTNGSVGNKEKLKQANTTIHPNFKMREPPHLRAVPFSEFKRAMRSTYNATQFLRIFAGKEATKEQLNMLLGNRHSDVSERPHSDNMPGRGVRANEDEDEFGMNSRSTETVIDKALDHVHEMMRSPLSECKYPQPEIVYVQDNEAKNRVYFPSCTVLHRCRNVTGCCKNTSSVCGPKRVKIVSKYFVVLDFASKNPYTTSLNTKMVEVRQFMNHTECECKEIIGLPGCKKDCPSPFKKTRVGLECECDCGRNHQNCLLIKDGIKPLHERSLVCIKNRDCQRPSCRYGFFNLNTGFCPHIQSGFNRNRRRFRQRKHRRNG